MAVNNIFQKAAYEHYRNNRRRGGRYPAALNKHLSAQNTARAALAIRQWRGYKPTPLCSLSSFAKMAGVRDVYYKDESPRFGIGSFKALGGGYAVSVLAREAANKNGKVTIAAATDGNHGRAVAWAAKQFGCQCRIYLHAGVSMRRRRAIEKFGATITRVKGDYDDSLRAVLRDSRANGWTLVSDTVCGGFRRAPRLVMDGYGVVVDEVLESLPRGILPSHVFVQGGVGGFAAAVCARLWQKNGARRGRFAVVESAHADCLLQSARAGKPRAVKLQKETVMAGLSCGEVSRLAFPVLLAGADDFISVPDEVAAPVMKMLRNHKPRITAGESAVAGLSLLLMAGAQPDLYRRLGLNKNARILLFGTEGATDPAIYRRMTR